MEIAAADRADARSMQESALRSNSWLAQNFIYLFAILLTLLTFGFIGWAIFFGDSLYQMTDDKSQLTAAARGPLPDAKTRAKMIRYVESL